MKTLTFAKFRIVFSILALFIATPFARALTINAYFDSSVTNSGVLSSVQSGFNTASQFFQNTYTDPVTVNLAVYWGASGPFSSDPGGAASLANYIAGFSYNNLYTALTNDAKSASDSQSINTGTFSVANPSPYNVYWVPSAEAKALNLSFSYTNSALLAYPSYQSYATGTISGVNIDGFISFNSATNGWFYNQGSVVSNQYDFVSFAEHEISEILGRISVLKATNADVLFDDTRFTGANTRDFTPGDAGVYFSPDNGTNNLMNFNSDTSGDIQDWAGDTNNPDAFDWQSGPGHTNGISGVDITTLDVIGWDVPEPSSVAFFTVYGVGSVVYFIRRRNRNR